MSSKFIPAKPSDVMVIRNITPNVVTLSVPFLRFGKFGIGGRATIVKLTSGNLAVFSPVALTDEVKAKVAELGGEVKYLIAPDAEHHIFLSEWATAYPGSILIGPEGLPERRLTLKDEKVGKEPFGVVFKAKNKRETKVSPEFDADFEYEFVDAHPNKEIAFLYKPDKILIEADLMFNLPATEQYSRVPEKERPTISFFQKLFYKLNTPGPNGESVAVKRLLWYGLSKSNRPGWNESIQRIASWDFVTLIPCHGDTIEGKGKTIFTNVFQWHISGKK